MRLDFFIIVSITIFNLIIWGGIGLVNEITFQFQAMSIGFTELGLFLMYSVIVPVRFSTKEIRFKCFRYRRLN